MFYNFVKSQVQAGKIKIRPSTGGAGGNIRVDAGGLTAVAVLFLSRQEKQQIAALSKSISMRRRKVRHHIGK